MALLPKLFPGLEARRRWKLPEPEHFDVRVDPSLTFDELVRDAGFGRILAHSGLDVPDQPLNRIYAPKGGAPYVERFELLQLCHDILDSEVTAMAEALKAGRGGDFSELSRLSDERRKKRGEHLSIDVDEALEVMAKKGYRPADAHEFLSFLAQHPRRQRRQYDIHALGAVYRHDDSVYELGVYDRPYRRQYDLVFSLNRSRGFHCWFLSHARFLATRLVP